MAQLVKNLPAMWETWVRTLGWEDLLEKRKATHSSILAWRIPWVTIHGVTKCQSDTIEGLSLSLSFFSSQVRLSLKHWFASASEGNPALTVFLLSNQIVSCRSANLPA